MSKKIKDFFRGLGKKPTIKSGTKLSLEDFSFTVNGVKIEFEIDNSEKDGKYTITNPNNFNILVAALQNLNAKVNEKTYLAMLEDREKKQAQVRAQAQPVNRA